MITRLNACVAALFVAFTRWLCVPREILIVFFGFVSRSIFEKVQTFAHPVRREYFLMLTLLTNDDGIFAPGLAAMAVALRQLGEVCVVAPATEQSGVGHAITFLTPLTAKEIFEGKVRRGWAVDGSPADAVKLAISQFCPRKPDLVVSGINGGLNAGINVLYSGTVAAAIEGAFFGITSIAVSLEYNEHAHFDRAAELAIPVIRELLRFSSPSGSLYNLNIPTAALTGSPKLRVVPMSVVRYGEEFEKRIDPRGRPYFWATNDPPPAPSLRETDVSALRSGCMTLTPLQFDLTDTISIESLAKRDWTMPQS